MSRARGCDHLFYNFANKHRCDFSRERTSDVLIPCMKIMRSMALLVSLAWLPVLASTVAAAPVYELRTYTSPPGKLDALLTRFRDHTCKLFEKHGMRNIGYWVPMDEKDGTKNTLIYFLAHDSRDAAKKSWENFMNDPEWKKVRSTSEAGGSIVSKVESVFFAPTDYSPDFQPSFAMNPRVFELRTYTAAPGKLAALDARFRGGETELFARAGMNGLVYLHPMDAAQGAGTTLVYLLAHQSRSAAEKSWQAFRDDPDWIKMRDESEADGKLVAKVQSVFLKPTDFSQTE